MTRCTTTSGPFRCEKDLGHQGECECEASPYATARLPCVIAAVPVAEARTESKPKDQPK